MKKFISLTIVLTMLLSVFYCFPAEARVYADYPYIYLDFEENNLEQLQANNEVGKKVPNQWKAGGAVSTNGCISLEESGDWANNTYFMKRPLTTGQTYRVSLWVKITSEDILDLTPRIECYFYTKSHDNKTARKMVTLQGTPTVGQWVHCTGTLDWNGIAFNEGSNKDEAINEGASVDLRVRIAAGGRTLWMELADEKRFGKNFKLQYDMDDIVVEPAVGAEKPVYDDSYLVAADFEDGSVGGLSGIKSVQDDPERGGKVGLVQSPIGQFNSLEAKNNPLKFNHLYKISCWLKRTDDYCEFGGEKSKVACINMAQENGTRQDFTNIAPTVQYPTYTKDGLTQNKWTLYEYYLKYDVKTFDGKGAVTGIRVGNSAASKAAGQTGEIGLEGVTYYVDDFLIQDLGFVQNGDFEHEQSEIYRIDAKGVTQKTDSVFGWLPEQATSSISTDVRSAADDPKTESTQSMSVNITSNGGRVYQGINFENNKKYKLSFWAKGLDMAEGEEKPISVVLDRKVETLDKKDVYQVEDYETLRDDKWTLTGEWKKYECDFEPKYVAGSTPDANVIPRTPFMYIDVDGNKAGTKFLVDDISFVDANAIVVKPEVNPYPRLEGVKWVEGEAVSGATVQIDYEFVSEVEGMGESFSVVRALISEDGKNWGCIGQSATYNSVSYTIPEIAIGKQLKLEIAPMDEVYQMGEIATVELGEVKKAFEIVPEINNWNKETGEVAASVFIENNLSSLGNQKIVVILALYNDNNTLISTTVKPEIITEQYSETIKISAISTASASKARLYVWSGTSLADAGEKSYCEAVSLDKNAVG